MGELVKSVFENGKNIFANRDLALMNIDVLKKYNISMKTDNNDSYSVLSMNNLEEKISYLKVSGLFPEGESISIADLKRAIINDNRKTCKEDINYGKIGSASSEEGVSLKKVA